MKEKNFLTYMNLLDDTYIEEAEIGAPVVRTTRKGKVLRRIPALVAATVTLMALLVVSAFATFDHWSSYLSLVFKGDIELLDDYTVAAKDVKYTSTNEDVKMEIVGYTGDENYAYVWVKMTLPEEFVSQFKQEDVDVLGFSQYDFLFWTGRFVGGKLNDNVYTFGLPVQATENNSPTVTTLGHKIELAIKDITVYLVDGTERTICGEWTAKFKLFLPDLSKKFALDISDTVLHMSEDPDDREGLGTHYKEEQLMKELHPQTCDVILSPMSVRLTVTYDNPDNLIFDAPRTMQIMLSDGSVVTVTILSYTTQHYSHDEPDKKEMIGLFKQPINPDDVVAIEYAGARIELK